MGAAHGVSTAASTSTGQSDAQYTAKHAWAQTISGSGATTLSIPSGERLTITFANGGAGDQCTVNATLNGATVS